MKFVSFPWSPVVASLSISMFCLLFTLCYWPADLRKKLPSIRH